MQPIVIFMHVSTLIRMCYCVNVDHLYDMIYYIQDYCFIEINSDAIRYKCIMDLVNILRPRLVELPPAPTFLTHSLFMNYSRELFFSLLSSPLTESVGAGEGKLLPLAL